MKKVIIFTTMLVLSALLCQAQERTISKASNTQEQPKEINYIPAEEGMAIDDFHSTGGGYVECFYYGDPSGMYLDDHWGKGKAMLVDGSTMEGDFRYNVYQQKMEAIIAADTFAFAKPCEIEMLMIGSDKFVFTNFIRDNQEVSNAWFEVLCEGHCSLLVRRYIKYRVSDGDDDISNDELYRLEEYYTQKPEGDKERLYMTKKSVLEAMTDHAAEVEEYMKANKLKMKERSDLLKLFAYYNGLD